MGGGGERDAAVVRGGLPWLTAKLSITGGSASCAGGSTVMVRLTWLFPSSVSAIWLAGSMMAVSV
jgi:hypothetical protein